jgi:hypothetical protein
LLVGNIDVNDLIANGLQSNSSWIKADMIEAGTITANKIKAGELVVGTNVTMGADATLSWGQVTGAPSFATSSDLANYVTNTALTTKLGQDYIVTGKIYANQITAGTITGFTINGSTISGVSITGAIIYTGNSLDGIKMEANLLYSRYSSPTLGPYNHGLYFDMGSNIIKSYDNGSLNPGLIAFGPSGITMNGPIDFSGSVNFSFATVTGITAKFG